MWRKGKLCALLVGLLISTATMEKAMAPHSSVLAWKIPWTEEPGRLQSMGSLGWGKRGLRTATAVPWEKVPMGSGD